MKLKALTESPLTYRDCEWVNNLSLGSCATMWKREREGDIISIKSIELQSKSFGNLITSLDNSDNVEATSRVTLFLQSIEHSYRVMRQFE